MYRRLNREKLLGLPQFNKRLICFSFLLKHLPTKPTTTNSVEFFQLFWIHDWLKSNGLTLLQLQQLIVLLLLISSGNAISEGKVISSLFRTHRWNGVEVMKCLFQEDFVDWFNQIARKNTFV